VPACRRDRNIRADATSDDGLVECARFEESLRAKLNPAMNAK
jgi:hypothetical protein